MPKKEPTYTKAVIICHGKSELKLADYIRSNLKLPIRSYADNNGKTSIQIASLYKTLGNTWFKNRKAFCDHFGFKNEKGEAVKGKIFIVMDLDDTDEKQREAFKSGKMFKNFWAKDMIVPIWNYPQYDEVMLKLGIIDHLPKDNEKGRLYGKAFPIRQDGKRDIDKIKKLSDMCKKCKNTNMDEMLEWLLRLSK